MEAQSANVVETLASLSLFGDLSYPELEAVAHTFEEEAFAQGQRVLRQDVSGGSFYVILSGEARVVIDGEERAALTRGDFFGEISVLTDTAPAADVVASTVLWCLVVPAHDLKPLLLSRPSIAYRMLQIEARRLHRANTWER
ncbi:MAG TPA: cyclic nucleotide-binding domain-containing protein [Gaiella sp.]|jgi:CRP-like cAMP-binding protein|nr:cyclic nucleotide-binding domain-containing protein [Gaiella sp.]